MNSSVRKQIDSTELVKRIIDGQREAEGELVEAFGKGIRFVLRRESRDPDAVDDLFQETFRIAIEKIRSGGLRDPRKLGSFLHSTAKFVTIDYFRREARHDNAGIDDYELPTSGQSQLHQLIDNEHAAFVRRTIEELNSDRDRSILFRFFIAQDEKEDICRDLDLSAIHFNRVLHRAKQRYKALFLEAVERAREDQS